MMRPINLTVPVLCALLLFVLAAACASAPTLAPTAMPPSPTPLPLPAALPKTAASPTTAPAMTAASAEPSGGATSFSTQVLPILQAKCSGCHNQDTKFGGLDASSYEAIMAGGNEGPVVIAGDVSQSLLVQKIFGLNDKPMPPAGPLSNEEIMFILNWISAGAPQN